MDKLSNCRCMAGCVCKSGLPSPTSRLFDIEALEGAALAILIQSVPHGKKHTLIANRHLKALADALKRNKESDNG